MIECRKTGNKEPSYVEAKRHGNLTESLQSSDVGSISNTGRLSD